LSSASPSILAIPAHTVRRNAHPTAMQSRPAIATPAATTALVRLLALLLAGSLGPVGATDAPITLQASQAAALGIRTQAAEGNGSHASARYPATLTIPASQQRVVASALPGMVDALLVSVGDPVRAGQVLAFVRSAQAQELQHDVHVAHSQAALAEAQLQRDEQLFKEGLIAASRLENTRTQAGLALEQREERALALTQAGGSAQGETTRITLRSPINGVVLERPVVLGQRIDASTALYRVATLAPLWLEMQVPAAQAADVRVGDSASVANAAGVGKVIGIGHAVDAASQTVLVRAEIRTPSAALRAGQAVEALLERQAPGLVRIPSAALIVNAGKPAVFVDDGAGRYRIQPVEAVSSAGGVSTVRGLPAGSPVVVQGLAALKSLLNAQRP
jgi:RND family efflux transporter MFP subunit